MKAVTRREIDMVAAWSVDRLGRSLMDLLEFLKELHAKGVDLFLHQQGYLGLVGVEAADVGRADHLDDILTLVGQRLDDRQHLLDQSLNVHRLDEDIHFPGLDLRQVEDVVDQPRFWHVAAQRHRGNLPVC